jgi:hypothetical protein
VSRSDGVLDLPLHGGHTYALEAGFGNSTLTIHGVMVVHILRHDRSSGDRTWGHAREMASFRDGAASGATTIEGVTVGLALQP